MTDHDLQAPHLTMEQLVALRDAGAEPGTAAARLHVESCDRCRGELARLDQRVARLRALPPLRPARDQWPAVRARLAADRRGRMRRWIVIGATAAAAAALALAVVSPRTPAIPDRQLAAVGPAPGAAQSLDAMQSQSQALEATLDAYDPDARVLDVRTARVAQDLEDRIARVDQELQGVDPGRQRGRALQLWNERVGLLDALVDVHVTRASNVGL